MSFEGDVYKRQGQRLVLCVIDSEIATVSATRSTHTSCIILFSHLLYKTGNGGNYSGGKNVILQNRINYRKRQGKIDKELKIMDFQAV